jgi:hypothetical protein
MWAEFSASGIPPPGKRITAFSIVAAALGPGSAGASMLEQGVPWPNLSPADVSNLMVYLNARDPAPITCVNWLTLGRGIWRIA